MDKIRILQLGYTNWNTVYILPECAELDFWPPLAEEPDQEKKHYDLVMIERPVSASESTYVRSHVNAYCLYIRKDLTADSILKNLYWTKMGRLIGEEQIQEFLLTQLPFYFETPYGEKYNHQNLNVSPLFRGSISRKGNYCLTVQGDFGTDFRQIVYWKNTIPVTAGLVLDFWLEYETRGEVEIQLCIRSFGMGTVDGGIDSTVIYTEQQLKNIVRFKADKNASIFVSINARGTGALRIIALHDRYSRGERGHFLPGGKRYVTSKREEIFAYFDPGDRKPPLNVYFSGYKTEEGFEGFNMMKRLGAPFLLISEARLEGGSFYMGSKEFENLLASVIQSYLQRLGFRETDLILSGISMGSTGALYYGSLLRPHAILAGKPLVNIGAIASNERLLRPGGFPTALDVLMYETHGTDQMHIRQLNQKFWETFDCGDFRHTKLVAAYMRDDDYDQGAYRMLLDHLYHKNAAIYGKGIPGRHNDNTAAIVAWFRQQFRDILQRDFQRDMSE